MNATKCLTRKNNLLSICLPLTLPKRNAFKIISRPDLSNLKTPQLKTKVDVPTQLQHKIKLGGPVTVADYMREVLTNPTGGYYMNKDMLGERGDFTTSPEISQLFGDILGVWLVNEWQKLGSPKPLQLVELGPGRATLLTDILRILWKLEMNKDDISIHLVEVSPSLQKSQAEKLCVVHKACDSTPHYHEGETLRGSKIYWYKDISDVPKKFSLILAHEFFDALPIHKFKKTEQGWREILIDIDSEKSNLPDDVKFKYVLSREETKASKLYVPLAANENLSELEVSPQSITIAKELSSRVDEFGGIALIVDYGTDGPQADTFRAFKEHKQVDPLMNAGSADLTADVDFSLLKKVAEVAKVVGPVTQKDFLLSMQAGARIQVLSENSSQEERDMLKSGFEMLTEDDQMGKRFKFMAFFPTINDEHYKKFPILGFN
ncbi:protein arginine methyltransferase NDUFAF7 homolog, mitochondrial [Arctopsyche grandis]|uniref:protein arginine methyltransferase NDUFAF7 homolog, mitochondrial n=1 Tax=Arctopsyche grandis TaxID=121162 RepID=UPI00406D9EB6